MANRELENKTYKIPSDVLKSIQVAKMSSSNSNGLKRANFILNNGFLSGYALKKLKHDFDKNNFADEKQYALAGGDLMKAFIDKTLQQERDSNVRSKNIKQDMTVDVNLGTMPYQTPRLNEEKNKKVKKNAIAVIVNNDNKILLLKRSGDSEWMPGKWGLVGGGIEKKDKNPQDAVKREIKEETKLEIEKFVKSLTIQRNPNSFEHIFACRYNGEPTDVTLNDENTNYGWFDVNEMNYLDIVPNLIEYIKLVFKKYE